MNLPAVERIFSGFHIATFADVGASLAIDLDGNVVFVQPHSAYGLVRDAVIGVAAGRIAWIVPQQQLGTLEQNLEVVHGHGNLLMPGLIDSHTHLIYGGNRAAEWERRLNGESYAAIAASGGGILSSVRATRAASEDELFASAQIRLERLISEGVTTIEIKSGYGLSFESELKMLRVARHLATNGDVDVVTTLLAAHTVPPEYLGRADAYVDLICRDIIPAAVAEGLCDSVDAFCETMAFTKKQTLKVLQTAREFGLEIKVHAEQLSDQGMAREAALLGALSVDHLEYLSEEDCATIGKTKTVANLLPGAFYCLHEKQLPPIEGLRKNQVRMAVATDSNPGSSPLFSMLFAGNMACNLFGLTPEETLRGMTINAAYALGRQDQIGSLEPGKRADFAVFNVSSPAELLYMIGHSPLIHRYRAGVLREPQFS